MGVCEKKLNDHLSPAERRKEGWDFFKVYRSSQVSDGTLCVRRVYDTQHLRNDDEALFLAKRRGFLFQGAYKYEVTGIVEPIEVETLGGVGVREGVAWNEMFTHERFHEIVRLWRINSLPQGVSVQPMHEDLFTITTSHYNAVVRSSENTFALEVVSFEGTFSPDLGRSRRVSEYSARCWSCGWIGMRKECKHGYIYHRGQDDTEPIDACPVCNTEGI